MAGLGLAVDAESRYLLAGLGGPAGTWLVPLDQGEPQRLEGFEQQAWRVALSADGRFAAAADGQFNPEDGVIRVWDLETGDVRILDRGEGDRGHTNCLDFTPENRLVSGGYGGIRRWNIDDGTFETLRDGEGEEPDVRSGLSPGGRFLASFASGDEHPFVHDLESGDSWEVSSHGEAHRLALDAAGKMLVTTGPHKQVHAGPITGEHSHLLLGHEDRLGDVAISPDGRWIASASQDTTIRLWPRPTGEPFHTLAHEDLLERLRALTNLRAIKDPAAEGGYRLEAGPFPGWEVVPTW